MCSQRPRNCPKDEAPQQDNYPLITTEPGINGKHQQPGTHLAGNSPASYLSILLSLSGSRRQQRSYFISYPHAGFIRTRRNCMVLFLWIIIYARLGSLRQVTKTARLCRRTDHWTSPTLSTVGRQRINLHVFVFGPFLISSVSCAFRRLHPFRVWPRIQGSLFCRLPFVLDSEARAQCLWRGIFTCWSD